MNTGKYIDNRDTAEIIKMQEHQIQALTKALEATKKEYAELSERYQLAVRLMNANVHCDDHLGALDAGG